MLCSAGCYQQMPPSKMASLQILAEPDTASVYIDDQYVGSARVLAKRPITLKPGVRFVTFQAPDYFPHDLKLDLPVGTTTVKMKLRPIPP
jgi:hypothetical protein